MGIFLQDALFPGCDEASARAAMEKVAENPDFCIDLEECSYVHSYEGTQVLIDGDLLGFEALAKALSEASVNPVMLLYIYDGDYWGYDFYSGKEEDHFNTCPDYFSPISEKEKQRLAGNPAVLVGCFPIWEASTIERYLVHWPDLEQGELAYPGDRYPYGDCWQMTDFAARLGFPWPGEEAEKLGLSAPVAPPLSALKEILEKNLPPLGEGLSEKLSENATLLFRLPSAFSADYIGKLLKEEGVQSFGFEEKNPQEILEEYHSYVQSVRRSESDPLCQRLAVLAAFCSFWLSRGNVWGLLDNATYEPLCGGYKKPTDIYVLRTRAAFTDFTKRHRALRDLKRLIELDPANGRLYRAEIRRWEREEQSWQEQMQPTHERMLQQFEEKKHQEEEREARRLQLILEKRRKK